MKVAAQRRSLVIIWITIFIDLMGLTIIIPFVNDFVDELGGDEQTVGLLLGSYAAMQLFFAPVWGRISDRSGRRFPSGARCRSSTSDAFSSPWAAAW